MSELSILNVGTGDTKISFDPNDPPEERIKAAAIVKDAIRRGYAILVEVGKDDKGPLYRRAHDFDENTCEYIIAGKPDDALLAEAAEPPKEEKKSHATRRGRGKPEPDSLGRTAGRGSRSRVKTSRVSATKRSAVAVGRTAGG